MKLMQYPIFIIITLFIFLSVNGETVVLQQGLDGYSGCKNLGIYEPVYPNKNYANNYTYQNARRVMISRFQC